MSKIKEIRAEFEARVKAMMEQANKKSLDLSTRLPTFKIWGLAEGSELLSISYGKRLAFNFVTETGEPFAMDVGGFTAKDIKRLDNFLPKKEAAEFTFE